jgi:integrase
VGEILSKAPSTDPAKGIKRAHLLVAFTAQRIAEVAGARWEAFDLDSDRCNWRMLLRREQERPASPARARILCV